jgi:hypothetical protein
MFLVLEVAQKTGKFMFQKLGKYYDWIKFYPNPQIFKNKPRFIYLGYNKIMG